MKRTFLVALASVMMYRSSSGLNNVCKTIRDYYTLETNPNCWHDDVVNVHVMDAIRKSGRPVIGYNVTTSDGYVLGVYRLPNKEGRYPVLLQHGLMTNCACWISLGNDSLAYQLYDHGYDVWLGNYRGTTYATSHVEYTVYDRIYWDHTLDDIALKDVPAMLKLINNETSKRAIYIGHSLGTVFPLMYTSEYPEESKQLMKFSILTAPVYQLKHIISPIKILIPFRNEILKVVQGLNLLVPISIDDPKHSVIRLTCMYSPLLMDLCFRIVLLGYGPKTSIKASKLPSFFDQYPVGTSLKATKHIADLIFSFSKYDFGGKYNKIYYGSRHPPIYNLTNIQVPHYIYYAKNDWLTSAKDSEYLISSFPEQYLRGYQRIEEPNFNHADFIYGSKSKENYVDHVIKLLETV